MFQGFISNSGLATAPTLLILRGTRCNLSSSSWAAAPFLFDISRKEDDPDRRDISGCVWQVCFPNPAKSVSKLPPPSLVLVLDKHLGLPATSTQLKRSRAGREGEAQQECVSGCSSRGIKLHKYYIKKREHRAKKSSAPRGAKCLPSLTCELL